VVPPESAILFIEIHRHTQRGLAMTRAMLRISPAALLLLAAACASGASTGVGTSAQTTTTIYTGAEGSPLTSVSSDAPVASAVATALRPDSAAVQLQAAYAVVGIPITLQDAATGRLGNPRFVTRSRIANEPMSRFLNCGQTLTGNRADRDQITMSIVTTVRPGPNGGSRVETLLTASAQDRTSGNVGDMIPCTTRGALESKIHRAAFGTG
jgi:hypothetical protein